ncbi:hypothetical protein FACS189431_3670 [Alphaproteobacteria bacterium]|nr:hypothetical protein FACS189431_3670 [Alphaproteobacteria bacterium]
MKKFFICVWQKVLELVARYRFAVMIILATAIALLLTSISITIYISSGAINVDLSRPGYEKVREDTAGDVEVEAPFPSSGPVDDSVRMDLLRRLDNLQADLDQMNDFGGDTLSDKSLELE